MTQPPNRGQDLSPGKSTASQRHWSWTRSEVIALARESCIHCGGYGWLRGPRRDPERGPEPCPCVLRAIFRVCYGRYRHCQTKAAHLSEARLEAVPSKRGRIRLWSRKDQEYSADFCLVARRELTRDEWAVFKAHYLEQRDWRACVKRLKTDRGRFFHSVYRIQQKLGRAFRSVAPYALFPLDEYFSGTCAYVSDREFGWRVPPVTDHA